jgi:site-specific recombinase XerD
LAAASVRCYVTQARAFLAELADPLTTSLAGLDAATVTAVMVRQITNAASVWSAKAFVTAVRSLLRFLHVQGLTSGPLIGAVPTVAGWRLSTLPRGLRDRDVQALLAAHDTTTPVGLRDHAVLTVLARLGLRGAEAAAPRLADIDWRAGQIVVRGKGPRVERLPFPAGVGEALAAYLTGGRPSCTCATVFVTARAPYQPLSPSAVRAIMGRACQQAGLPRVGAHRLRHTLATDLLRAGSPLAEVGQVLRHRSQLSTAIYAKVDHDSLRSLARPAGRCAMSGIRGHAEQYLAMRRALGFKLATFGQRLLSFVSYLEAQGQSVLTTEAALAWATSTPRSTDQVHWSRRLMVVRVFARHLAALDPATEVPGEDILPHHYRRITPYLYTPEDVAALLDAADTLRPPLRALTYRTLIGLLMVTGLRTGEACRLDRDDVDLDDGVLAVRDSKFGKSRQVPVHATTVDALRHYGQCRDEMCPTPSMPGFFVSTRGTRLDETNIPSTFAVIIAAAGITVPVGQRRPRLDDLRH